MSSSLGAVDLPALRSGDLMVQSHLFRKVGQEEYRQIFGRMERNAFAVRLVGDMAPGIPLDVFDVRPVSRLSDSGNVPR